MILHTIDATPASPAFADCLRLAAAGDAILLLGDGVYGACEGGAGGDALLACGAAVYLLAEHAVAAGVEPRDGVELVDMDGFVALSEQYPRQQAWY